MQAEDIYCSNPMTYRGVSYRITGVEGSYRSVYRLPTDREFLISQPACTVVKANQEARSRIDAIASWWRASEWQAS